MAHFYQIINEGGKDECNLLQDVTTVPQWRKWLKENDGTAYASITTKLDVAPNGFLDSWRIKEAIRITKENPSLPEEEVLSQIWGMRECPATGEPITSSDFGTQGHKHLEISVQCRIAGAEWEDEFWEPYVVPFHRWMWEQSVEPVSAEQAVYCHRRKVAGTVDLFAVQNKRIQVYDYKFRDGRKNKKNVREKDVMQMAVQASIVKDKLGLPYMPEAHTVLICPFEATMRVVKWEKEKQEAALERFEVLSRFWDEWFGGAV